MRKSSDIGLEQNKTFSVSADEFKEKIENFQTRFHILERANKCSIIRWIVGFLLLLVVAVLLGYVWWSNYGQMQHFEETLKDMQNMLQQEKMEREREVEKRESLEKVLTHTYSVLGGSNSKEGNLYVNGRPVCDDSWDLKDATVACKSLGFEKAVKYTRGSAFGSVIEKFMMDDVKCNGTETSLLECAYDKTDDCTAKEGAGVICS